MTMSRLNVIRRGWSAIRLSLFVSLSLFTMAVSSCSETDDEDTEYQNWEARNNEYFEDIYQHAKTAIDAGDPSWLIVKSWSKDASIEGSHTDHIVIHVISQQESHNEQETTLDSPLYTDSVRVHYRGRLMPTASYAEGKQFDSSWQGNYDLSVMVPAKMAVRGNIDGFTTALMGMHVGDRWEIYIPWQLAYGSNSTSASIPNCSVLHFDLTLHSIGKPGTKMPDFK